MSKAYCFEYPGTRESFLELLERFQNNNHSYFYFNDYIVDVRDSQYAFGVARSGHSGGYWYKPTAVETDEKIVFTGDIQRSSYDFNAAGDKKKSDKIAKAVFSVILSPLLLLVEVYILVKSLIRRTRRKPPAQADTPEEKLCFLMENILGCVRM